MTSQPYDGYDRLNERHVMKTLCDHSQAELAAIEKYERSHKNREAVLDKLGEMRCQQPIDGYDDLSTEKIVAALEKADLSTIKDIRAYERKFANRPDVMSAVARVHHRYRGGASPAPSRPA